MSDGIVSALRKYEGVAVIQVTAAISPGSSGSPVFSRDGKVLGTATFSRRDSQSLNFAIPVGSIPRGNGKEVTVKWADHSAEAPTRAFGDPDSDALYDLLAERYLAEAKRQSTSRPALDFAQGLSAIGHLDDEYRVFQVLSNTVAIVDLIGGNGLDRLSFRVDGVDLSGHVDKQGAKFAPHLVFVGKQPFRYTTVLGGTRTIFSAHAVDSFKLKQAISRHTSLEAALRAEEQRRQAALRAEESRRRAILNRPRIAAIESSLADLTKRKSAAAALLSEALLRHAKFARHEEITKEIRMYEPARDVPGISRKPVILEAELAGLGRITPAAIQASKSECARLRREVGSLDEEIEGLKVELKSLQ